MSLYVDSSALLKRYLDEPDSEQAEALLAGEPELATARHSIVEVRRNLVRLLSSRDAAAAAAEFAAAVPALSIVELDAATCERAASIAELTGVRTLDALHLGAAQRACGPNATVLTFDARQAQAARSLGMTVLGA